jgi:hypothetical protein
MDMDNNLKLTGTYVFFEDGKEIHRQSNLLTRFGKRFFTQVLTGQYQFINKDIAVGAGSTAATVNDTQLEFEFYRSKVNLGSVDIQTSASTGDSTYAVVYKSTLPVDANGEIHEVGLFPSITIGDSNYNSQMISSMENTSYWYDSDGNSGTVVYSILPRVGAGYFQVSAESETQKEYFYDLNIDLSGYSVNDSLSIAYKQSDLNLDYIAARFYSSSTDYYEIRFPSHADTNYHIDKLTLANLYDSSYKSGNPDASAIIKMSIVIQATSGGQSNVLFDGIRINDEDSFKADYGLISRSVMSTPILKTLGRQMDIEYRIELTF